MFGKETLKKMGIKMGTVLEFRSQLIQSMFGKKLLKKMGNKMGALVFRCQKPCKKLDDDDDDVQPPPRLCHAEEDDNESFKSCFDPDSRTFVCGICVEETTLDDSFNIKGCAHFYCTECIVRYVASKLENNLITIICPESGCDGVLDPDFCRDILSKKVFDRWGTALCECLIDTSQKVYCPYKDCSALIINEAASGGEKRIDRATCPFCKREFCVNCSVPWHSEIDCSKFQKLSKEGNDSLLKDLARRKNWKKCPNCKFLVEKSVGCCYMKCRCGYAFCYNCGASLGSSIFHVCKKCNK